MEGTFELETPVFLVAMPQVMDPFFHKSVVLLIRHQEEGSFGLVVNRPTDLGLAEILEGLEIDWDGAPESKAFCGGPVQPQLGTVIFHLDDVPGNELGEAQSEICSGVGMSQHVGDLEKLTNNGDGRYRLLLGYAQWGSGQLTEEFLRNDWLVAPVDTELIFGDNAVDAWEATLASMGIQPGSLPSWTQATDSDGPAAN